MNRLCARALPLLALLAFPMPAVCQMTAYLFVWDGASETEVFAFPLPETVPVESVEPTRRIVLEADVRATAVDPSGQPVVLLDGSPPALFDLDIDTGQLTRRFDVSLTLPPDNREVDITFDDAGRLWMTAWGALFVMESPASEPSEVVHLGESSPRVAFHQGTLFLGDDHLWRFNQTISSAEELMAYNWVGNECPTWTARFASDGTTLYGAFHTRCLWAEGRDLSIESFSADLAERSVVVRHLDFKDWELSTLRGFELIADRQQVAAVPALGAGAAVVFSMAVLCIGVLAVRRS